jgi:hypothetical protein
MTQRTPVLMIDARPRGPSGPLAVERVLGRPVLAHLIELAESLQRPAIKIHARLEEFDGLRTLVPPTSAASCTFAPGPPPAGAFVLRADRLYDPRRLRRAWRRGGDPESAVLWRLDGPSGLAGADDELLRRRSFQPLGRYWALRPARRLARHLEPTRVRPNHLTLLANALVLAAAGSVAWGGPSLAARLGSALALAVALILDTADGHLARLQGTASAFGRWLDAFLDELGDMALHAGIAWSLSRQGTQPGWLLLGMAYAIGKYLFAFGNSTWDAGNPAAPHVTIDPPPGNRHDAARRVVQALGHADLRWHLWIALAAIGRLDVELVLYGAYYPLRALLGAWRKAARHA